MGRKKYVHLVTHRHAYGEDAYVFFSFQNDHTGEDIQEELIKLLDIDFDAVHEELDYRFDIQAPTFKS